MKKLIVSATLIVSFLFFITLPVMAAEWSPTFKISQIAVFESDNYHFRVYSDSPSQAICTGGIVNPSWSYLNESDSGAKGKIATLLTAFAQGKSIQVYSTNNGGYCWITGIITH